jgi:hypothetical protein
MKRLGVFATGEQVRRIQAALNSPAMFLSGGQPTFDSAVERCYAFAIEQGLPEIPGFYGIDLTTGEFISA